MKAATVSRHSRLLRRICEGSSLADAVPDHVPDFERVLVGDLPALTMTKIAACYQADRLAAALREWVREGMPA